MSCYCVNSFDFALVQFTHPKIERINTVARHVLLHTWLIQRNTCSECRGLLDHHRYPGMFFNNSVEVGMPVSIITEKYEWIWMKFSGWLGINTSNSFWIQIQDFLFSFEWYCHNCLARLLHILQTRHRLKFMLTLHVLNFSEGTKTYIYILYHSSTLTWHRELKSFLK